MKWIHPMTYFERFYHAGQPHKTLMVCYRMRLNSQKPITEEILIASLQLLFREVPTLRFCIQKKDEMLWFAEMDNEKLDYKFQISDISSTEEMYRIIHTSYNAGGPLWRASLIRTEESGGEFPCNSNFFIGFHHAITDGIANIKICEMFFQILDKILGGKPVAENKLGVFYLETETDALEAQCRERLLVHPDLNEKKRDLLNELFNKRTHWTEAFGINDGEHSTKHLEMELDTEATKS